MNSDLTAVFIFESTVAKNTLHACLVANRMPESSRVG